MSLHRRPPAGKGRGSEYGPEHLARLKQIQELKAAGHSLDAVARILDGATVEAPVSAIPRRSSRLMATALWTRVTLLDGIEIHLDATKHNPSVEALVALREAIRTTLGLPHGGDRDPEMKGR